MNVGQNKVEVVTSAHGQSLDFGRPMNIDSKSAHSPLLFNLTLVGALLLPTAAFAGEPAAAPEMLDEEEAAPEGEADEVDPTADYTDEETGEATEEATEEPTKEEEMAAAMALAEENDHPAKNSVYAELLGPAILYSINYERMFIDQLGVRVGFAYWAAKASAGVGDDTVTAKAQVLKVPITASYTGVRHRANALEVLAGGVITWAKGSASSGLSSASASGVGGLGVFGVGYRLHPVGGAGFQFRIGMMGLVGPGLAISPSKWGQDKVGMLPWGYMSFGGSF